MSPDGGEPTYNLEVAKRAEVDRVKGLIKADNLIFRGHDVDNPGLSDLDDKTRDLIRSFGLEKVETVQQLFDSVNDPNRGHDDPKQKLDILATAVCEVIIEAGKSDIVVAGSSSVEKQLFLTEFSARDKNNEEAPSFAFMVAEKFRERFSAGDTRNNVTITMEYLDYIKNSAYGKNGGLEEAADQAYESLLQTKPNVLSKKEMQARAAVLRYVSSLRSEGKKSSTKSEGLVRAVRGGSEESSLEEALVEAELLDSMEIEKVPEDDSKETGEKVSGRSLYFLTPQQLVNVDMRMRHKDQIRFSEPYPPWLEALPFDEQTVWLIRCKLINGVAYKQDLRNVNTDKLFFNESLDLNEEEMRLLCSQEGFQETLQTMFTDLFTWEKGDDGEKFLRLRQRDLTDEEKNEGKVGRPLDYDVEYNLTHFEIYKEKLAFKLQFPNTEGMNRKDYDAFIDKKYNEYYQKNKRAGIKYRGAVGLAWDLAYIGNIIESADVDRQLKPTEVVSDKLRTIMHPMIKALAKLGIWKEGKLEITTTTDEEESKDGDISSWIRYHVELGDMLGDDTFRKKLQKGEICPLPRRAMFSLLEMYMVTTENSGKNKITMAEALMKKEKIVFKDKNGETLERGSDLDIFTDYRDAMDGCRTAYNYLTGTVKLEVGKNEYEWARKFNSDVALIRAMNHESLKNGKRAVLPFVDDPEFIAWVIAASAGFEIKGNRIVLNFKSIGADSNNYDLKVKNIINLPDLIKLGSRNGKVEQILGADKGYWATKIMLDKHNGDVATNEAVIRKHNKIKKRESGSDGRDYTDYGATRKKRFFEN